jgi:uncharacterized membrane protein YcaP (DUF421 family)
MNMQSEPVVAFDLGRMLLGDEPPLFLLEIALRTVLIYVYTLALIRWIGSRSIAQLSLVEFLLVIALGSAVGDAMFYPDVPLVHCMIVITVVVLLDKALSFLVARNSRLEDVIEGKSVELVRNGLIRRGELRRTNMGLDELFEQLRLKGIRNLAEVRAAFLETNGMVSVFENSTAKTELGLSIDPPWDIAEPTKHDAGSFMSGSCTLACCECAAVVSVSQDDAVPQCQNCGSEHWHVAQAIGLK